MAFEAIKKLIHATGPSTALQELLYGFIMALIFVYATRFGILDYEDPLDFLIVITGMNATWGVIDGIILYYLAVCSQRRYIKILSDKGGDRERKINELMDEFGSTPLDVLQNEDMRKICETMLDRGLQSEEDSREDRRSMMYSSIGCIIVTLMTLIPFYVVLLLVPDFMFALKVVSFVVSAILFFIGYYMGPYLGVNRWIAGITLMLISLSIALISTFTGG